MLPAKSTVTIYAVICVLGLLPFLSPRADAQGCLPREYRDAHGPATCVAASGPLAVFSSGSVLEVVDRSNPGEPEVISEIDLDLPIADLALGGRLAYAATVWGLAIVDLTDPSSPRLRSTFDDVYPIAQVVASGRAVYAVSQYDGVWIVDASNPMEPELATVYVPPTAGPGYELDIRDVAFSDDRVLLVTSQLTGLPPALLVLDVSSATNPVQIGSFDIPQRGNPRGLAASGSRAYVDAHTGLWIVDLSDPSAPVEVGVIDDGHIARSLAADDARLYRGILPGVAVFDVTDPTQPVHLADIVEEEPPSGLQLSSNELLAAAGSSGLRIFDVGDPSFPQHIETFHTPGSSKLVTIHGNEVFIAEEAGLRILDVSNLPPTDVGFCPHHLGTLRTVAYNDGFVYLGHMNGMDVISVEDTSAPFTAATMEIHEVEGISIDGSRLYVMRPYSRPAIFDVSAPDAPVMLGELGLPFGGVFPIEVVDGLAYGFATSGSGEGRLYIFDINNPEQPVTLGSVSIGLDVVVTSVDIQTGIVYMAGVDYVNSWLWTVDARDPTNPVVLGSFESGFYGLGGPQVEISGTRAILSNPVYALWLLDIRSLESPVDLAVVGDISFRNFAVADRYVVVARGTLGFDIYDIRQACAAPRSGSGRVEPDSIRVAPNP